jgi:hypothetical protein
MPSITYQRSIAQLATTAMTTIGLGKNACRGQRKNTARIAATRKI